MTAVLYVLLTVVVALIALVIYTQVFFFRQTQLLVNKIMSGDYHAYVRSEKPADIAQRVPAPPDPPEDLRILQGFQL